MEGSSKSDDFLEDVERISESMMRKLSVEQLGDYLTKNGLSQEAIHAFSKNNVTGKALLLLEDDDIKGLIDTIGDRAVLRNLLREVRKVMSHNIIFNKLMVGVIAIPI